MKTAFVVLLFCSLVYGQDNFELKLLKVLEQYEQECYADSTLECFLVYVYDQDTAYQRCSKFNMIDPGINPNYQGSRKIWAHREPTFNGFIKFLKE